MKIKSSVALAVLHLSTVATLCAQSPGLARYRFGPDTLHYREVTNSISTTRAPNGDATVVMSHDARIAIRGAGDGRAEAWYEDLALRREGSGAPSQVPSTNALIGRPFALTTTATGRISTRIAPLVPPEVAAISDVSHQFDDFFITMPTRPVAIGASWADTVVRARGTLADSGSRSQHIRAYRVERDTMIAGARGVVISVHQKARIESTTPLPGGRGRVVSRLNGDEDGSAVFILTAGRLHSRERRGVMAGKATISNGAQSLEMPQRYEYTSTLSLPK